MRRRAPSTFPLKEPRDDPPVARGSQVHDLAPRTTAHRDAAAPDLPEKVMSGSSPNFSAIHRRQAQHQAVIQHKSAPAFRAAAAPGGNPARPA